ncbi:TerB family tellurite resistance protein [Parvularcula dongshanensis]|uniref:Putative tellurite resistance protein B-like protein n=1 Tax=Parvularcula dongshanensis TaxID=1173995 RepID=A0A840I247_9PROT|nr:TerB family tellurite resistance protein [Parvularcula dongshanensis]MBB4658361.1 putative tellurite resistance protein B-like protein [Parvularcula dongshanensis]
MLGKLFEGFKKEEPKDEAASVPRALAALLVEAARADEDYTDAERAVIDRVLERRFSMSRDEARTTRIEAETDQAEASDLYGFSHVVRDGLDREGKLGLIEDMWRVVLTDETRDPFEEQVIRRLVGLLHLEDTDSTTARRRAEAASRP